MLVESYKLGHITREVLWFKLGVRALWVFAWYNIQPPSSR